MRQSTGLASYPVFPNWVFDGTLQVDDATVAELLGEIKLSQATPYGYATPIGKMTQGVYNLTRLVGTVFYDTVVPHFRLGKEWRNIESVDAQMLHVKPGKCVPHSVSRHRWYRSAAFLQCGPGSSDIYLEMMDSKLHCNPPGAQEHVHTISNEHLRVVYWPAHIPWGLTYNESKRDTIVFTSTFIIKRTE